MMEKVCHISTSQQKNAMCYVNIKVYIRIRNINIGNRDIT